MQALLRTERRSKVRMAKGERGAWQRRFWGHVIREEADYARRVDYCTFDEPWKVEDRGEEPAIAVL